MRCGQRINENKEKMSNRKKSNKILIVDDSAINRAILADMLEERYEILEAENGVEAVELLHNYGTKISLVLLDVVMPKMDGFEVLAMMNRCHWIEEIPVIMISAENSHSVVERAYELGAADYISRPFDEVIVCRRVVNTMMLYSKQKRLISMIADQMYESEKNSTLMISILSHIVEFRNGESGLHVLHIGTVTEMLLKRLREKTDKYNLSPERISLISKAAAFHDIGKISISEEILNKPGRLTEEEFEIMKTHSLIGANMLEDLPLHKEEPLVEVAYEICRWHHERYDGRGYPDGLKGEEIPISAQAVSIADAYDALTSERVYKKAFSHEKSLQMILNGECGCFHPLLLECLSDISDRIQEELTLRSFGQESRKEIRTITEQLLSQKEITASNRTLNLLEEERIKFQFFSSLSSEIQFEYTNIPSMLTLSEWGAKQLNLPQVMLNPMEQEQLLRMIRKEDLSCLEQLLKAADAEHPVVEFECDLVIEGIHRRKRLICRTMWGNTGKSTYEGVIGKVLDSGGGAEELNRLQQLVMLDPLTGLYNRAYARKKVESCLQKHPEEEFAMMIFDLDYFKNVNRQRGHSFGNRLLKYMAELLRSNVEEGALIARIGGDEFLVFQRCHSKQEDTVEKIFESLTGEYDGVHISVSMGIAATPFVDRSYDMLYRCADRALYEAKCQGPGNSSNFKMSMQTDLVPTAISEIEETVKDNFV